MPFSQEMHHIYSTAPGYSTVAKMSLMLIEHHYLLVMIPSENNILLCYSFKLVTVETLGAQLSLPNLACSSS